MFVEFWFVRIYFGLWWEWVLCWGRFVFIVVFVVWFGMIWEVDWIVRWCWVVLLIWCWFRCSWWWWLLSLLCVMNLVKGVFFVIRDFINFVVVVGK